MGANLFDRSHTSYQGIDLEIVTQSVYPDSIWWSYIGGIIGETEVQLLSEVSGDNWDVELDSFYWSDGHGFCNRVPLPFYYMP